MSTSSTSSRISSRASTMPACTTCTRPVSACDQCHCCCCMAGRTRSCAIEARFRISTGAQDDYADEPTFDVVVPSLPGFAFTGLVAPPPRSHRSSPRRSSASADDRSAGYEQFIVAGGDGGSAIAQSMAIQFPASVIGIHLTDIGWHDHERGVAHATSSSKYMVPRSSGNSWRTAPMRPFTCLAAARAGREPQRFAGRPGIVDRRPLSFLVRFAAASRAAFQQ